MASPTQWTWVYVNSGSWWWTGRPGVLQSVGSQRVGHDWATELNWNCYYINVIHFCLFNNVLNFTSILKFFWFPLWASLVAQLVKNPPATWETWVQSLGWKDPPGAGRDYPLQCSGISLMLSSLIHEVRMHECVLSHFSRVWVFMTQWTIARQAPLSLGVSRQGYWRELPHLPPGIFPTQGWKPHL